jgi:hypothetical protein
VGNFFSDLTGSPIHHTTGSDVTIAQWLHITDSEGNTHILNTRDGSIVPLPANFIVVESSKSASGSNSWHMIWSPQEKVLRRISINATGSITSPPLLNGTSFLVPRENDGTISFITEDGTKIFGLDQDGNLKLRSEMRLLSQANRDAARFQDDQDDSSLEFLHALSDMDLPTGKDTDASVNRAKLQLPIVPPKRRMLAA